MENLIKKKDILSKPSALYVIHMGKRVSLLRSKNIINLNVTRVESSGRFAFFVPFTLDNEHSLLGSL